MALRVPHPSKESFSLLVLDTPPIDAVPSLDGGGLLPLFAIFAGTEMSCTLRCCRKGRLGDEERGGMRGSS